MPLSKTSISSLHLIILIVNFTLAYLYVYKHICNIMFDYLEMKYSFTVIQPVREAIVYFVITVTSVALSYPRLKNDGFLFSTAQINDASSIMLIAVLLMLLIYSVFGKANFSTVPTSFNIFLNLFIPVIASPIIEEIFFRYAAYEVLNSLVSNKIVTVLLISFLFALLHLRTVSHGSILYYFLIYCVMGISYQVIYIKTSNLPLCICVHCIWNAFTIIGAFLFSILGGN